ncbi:DUF4387 domain-containing protein [Caulobacter sp. KR2-114]|uniref:DUF4387 domain-containing protein n=1 Tax=Caulobacter sp. KR2-114 TaxID=3400912 RepID=UPI003C00C254
MPEIRDVCRHVRSKNAGPFWITLDLFFHDRATFDAWVGASALREDAIGRLFGAPAGMVRRFEVPELCVLKLSYPRPTPQGGELERDMHGGQQYVRLLGVELAPATAPSPERDAPQDARVNGGGDAP